MPNFGENLKAIRIKRGMTQDELAELLNTSKQVISRYENGQRYPKISAAARIAKALGVSLAELNGDPQPQPVYHSSTLSPDETRLVELYRSLNADGKRSLMKQAEYHANEPDYQKDTSSEMA